MHKNQHLAAYIAVYNDNHDDDDDDVEYVYIYSLPLIYTEQNSERERDRVYSRLKWLKMIKNDFARWL